MKRRHYQILLAALAFNALAGWTMLGIVVLCASASERKQRDAQIDVATGFRIDEMIPNEVYRVSFDETRMSHFDAYTRAMKRLPGGFDAWTLIGSHGVSGTNVVHLHVCKRF